MKKMKRFLSLLICMVMLMSVLPMGASAAHVHDWRGEFTFINDDPSGHYYDCNYCDYTTEKEDHWFYVGEWYGTYYDGSECFTCHYKKPQTYNITYMDGTTKLTDLTPATYTEGTGATLPGADKVTKLGYTFAGWYNNDMSKTFRLAIPASSG